MRTALFAAALAAAPAAAQDHQPLRAANAEEQRAKAAVVIADYRYGDLLWENDRTAHRIYSRTLEAAEPPSSSGIDAWGKRVRFPYMDRQLRTGDQHSDHGEGLDFYNVGTGRGTGGLGPEYFCWSSLPPRCSSFATISSSCGHRAQTSAASTKGSRSWSMRARASSSAPMPKSSALPISCRTICARPSSM